MLHVGTKESVQEDVQKGLVSIQPRQPSTSRNQSHTLRGAEQFEI
jgi:hypothetical protein